jgi:hypothetical protein
VALASSRCNRLLAVFNLKWESSRQPRNWRHDRERPPEDLAPRLPNMLLARGMTKRVNSAAGAVAGFMGWEFLKIGASIAMLVLAPKVVPGLSWPALLVTLAVCIKVNWLALAWRGRRLN